ncbi:pyrroloquinoline quinone biosynthesis protein B [Scopulibacillus darangshiensis]|uniref:Pyrroloquinoline quinone biosynthesis protein B n=1 Tax=Scopulibacillus darangshiensis TaxID=442528 RepID=A0A4R2P4D2_9BACL|nr:MBL fold metallo-hydrolase [Scopulibacillus darangshiensis]TCP29602.1 pyrroloquinoline quinone biosynthesis protein B [Scopulibacillus darangshiensis]
MNAKAVIKVLGTAQDGGVPQANCTCDHCLATYENPKLKRFAAALAVILPNKQRWHLIDATPDLREQMATLRQHKLGLMDSVLLTHAHIGHYTGLMFLGKESISTKRLPVYADDTLKKFLSAHAPWKQLIDLENIRVKSMQANETFEIDDHVTITPLEVPHRNEYSNTFGFIISGTNKKLLYIPDIDSWEVWQQDIRHVAAEMDYCLLDGTFYSEQELEKMGRTYKEVPHPLLTHTMDLLQEVASNGKTKVYFTHFNHTNAAIDPNSEVREIIKSRGFFVAEEGMEIPLSL